VADKIYALSEKDHQILQEFLRYQRKLRVNPLHYPTVKDDMQTPDIYVAQAPSGGLAQIKPEEESGFTGTGFEAGAADCQIYRVVLDDNSNPHLEAVSALIRTVYNVSGRDILEHAYFPVVRDKWGSWLAAATGPSDVLIVRAPFTGIPALTEQPGTEFSEDQSNNAVCNVYHMADDGRIRPSNYSITVWNVNQTPIFGNQWLVVVRSRDEHWLAINPRIIVKGVMTSLLQAGGLGTMDVYDWDQQHTGTGTSDTEESPTGGTLTVYDWLLRSGQTITSGTRVIVAWIGGRWYVIAAQCP
jgi:hypothetical protein